MPMNEVVFTVVMFASIGAFLVIAALCVADRSRGPVTYPLPPKAGPSKKQLRRWAVEYDLVYEAGGAGRWVGYYRTWLSARVAIAWNRHVSSYGGTAVLRDRAVEARQP